MRAEALLLAVALVAAPPVAKAAWRRDRIVVLVDGRGDPAAKTQVGAAVAKVLAGKSYDVVPAAEVLEFLAGEDAAAGEPLPSGLRRRLAKRFRAKTLVTVGVGFLLDQRARPKGPSASAAIGLTVTLASAEDRVLWRNSLGSIGDELAAANEGARAEMITTLCERLLWAMPQGTPNPDAQVAHKQPPATVYRPSASAPPRYDAIADRVPDLRSGPQFRLLVGRRTEEPAEGQDTGSPDGGSR